MQWNAVFTECMALQILRVSDHFRDPRSVYSRPGPLSTSAFFTNADGGLCVRTLYNVLPMGPVAHGITVRALSYNASALLMIKDFGQDDLSHDSDPHIKSDALDQDPRDLRDCPSWTIRIAPGF